MNEKDFLAIICSAWNHMVNILFKPFNIVKWIIIAFAAWLTLFAQDICSILNLGSYIFPPPEFLPMFTKISSAAINIAVGGGIMFAVGMVFLWIMSRGEFIYIDKLVNPSSAIPDAWKKFSALGNSLFLWRITFAIVTITVCLIILSVTGLLMGKWLYTCFQINDLAEPDMGVWIGLAFLFIGGMMAMIFMYITYIIFMKLGIPVMYRKNIKSFKALLIVFHIIKTQPLKMLEYLIILFLLNVLSFYLVLVLMISTCCIFYVLVALPFIGTVALLPLITFMRFFDLEYLAKFGEEYNLLPQVEK